MKYLAIVTVTVLCNVIACCAQEHSSERTWAMRFSNVGAVDSAAIVAFRGDTVMFKTSGERRSIPVLEIDWLRANDSPSLSTSVTLGVIGAFPLAAATGFSFSFGVHAYSGYETTLWTLVAGELVVGGVVGAVLWIVNRNEYTMTGRSLNERRAVVWSAVEAPE